MVDGEDTTVSVFTIHHPPSTIHHSGGDMFDGTALLSMAAFLGVFLLTYGVAVIVFARFEGDSRRGVARLRELGGPAERAPERGSMTDFALSALPRVGALLLPQEGSRRARLRTRLNQAGLYSPQAIYIFVAAQLLLAAILPVALALTPYLLGWLGPRLAGVLGAVAFGIGIIAPGFWVDAQKKKRQATFRKGLPDALDMLVLCLEGGISLTAAVQRVTAELHPVHPLLATEMNIVQREMQLGLSAGEALRKFGERCDLEELRNLASVLLQSERFGASVVKALRIHADTSRQERQQLAEELAQKAGVKILFPTLLCIFPATFLVVLGPAAYQIAGMFSKLK
jgi:tight adherence protein C